MVGKPVDDVERTLLALLVHLGGLGISDPRTIADSEFIASIKVTRPLVDCILQQQGSFGSTVVDCQHQAKAEVVTLRRQHQSDRAAELKSSLPSNLQRILSYAVETGASSWLTGALPIEEHGFALHKGAFKDALHLRYGWHPSGLPSTCVCSIMLLILFFPEIRFYVIYLLFPKLFPILILKYAIS